LVATQLTETPAKDSRAGWWVLIGCCVLASVSISSLFGSSFGLFIRPLEEELRWTRSEIAFSFTILMLLSPIIAPATGWVIDHVRLRLLVLWGVLLQSANLLAFSLMGDEVWVFYLTCGSMLITGAGASLLALSKVVQSWFDRSLGRALGILFACAAAGAIVHPMLVQAVIAQVGWRGALQVMAALSLLCGGVAAWWIVDERRSPAMPAVDTVGVSPVKPRDTSWLATLARSRAWWVLSLWNMSFAFGAGSIGIHLAALLQERGASPAQGAMALSLMGVGALIGNLAAGWLIDRTSARRLAGLVMLLPMTAALLLYGGAGYEIAILAAVVLGLSTGTDGSLCAFLAQRFFGPSLFGRASATQMVAASLGGGLSPWLSGLLRDSSGNYQLSLLMAAGAFGIAAASAIWLPAADQPTH
jgi:cyanate permease